MILFSLVFLSVSIILILVVIFYVRQDVKTMERDLEQMIHNHKILLEHKCINCKKGIKHGQVKL